MKKLLLTLLLSGCLLLCLAACGGQETTAGEPVPEEPMTGVTEDALHDITGEEMVRASGLDLPAPAGAENVSYHVLCASQECPIAEMRFTLDGQDAYLRAQSTAFIPEEPAPDASLAEIEAATDITNYDISGLYFEPQEVALCDVIDTRPGIYWLSEEYGVLGWVDVAPGILYNLCIAEATDAGTLQTLADTVFVPLQGEADGDAEEGIPE